MLVNAGNENDGSSDALKALTDPEIRKAISMGIDREAILQVLGYGDLAYELHGLIPKGFTEVAKSKSPVLNAFVSESISGITLKLTPFSFTLSAS